MNLFKRFANKSFSDIYVYFKNLLMSRFRFVKLTLQAKLHGAKIQIGRNVKFNHKVSLQGKGKLVIHDNVVFGYHMAGSNDQGIILQVRFSHSQIIIGENAQIMNGCELFSTSAINIGKDVLLGAGVKIMDSDFHELNPSKRFNSGPSIPIIIHNNCWVGIDSLLLKGTVIGENSVVGAKSVVNSNLEANSVYGGVPAKFIKSLS